MKICCKLLLIFCMPALIFPIQLRSYEIPPQKIAHEYNTQIPTLPCTLEEMFIFIEQFDHDEFWESLTETEFLNILEFQRILVHWGTDLRDIEAHQAIDEEYEEILRLYYEDCYGACPTSLSGNAHIELCGGVFYCIKKVGRHFKRNKKEYIIGTVIVVGIAVGCYALAAPAAAALSSDSDHKDKSSSAEPAPAQEIMQETIIAYQEELSTAIEPIPNTPSLWSVALQNTKEVGAYFAHELLDEVTEIASVAPALAQEIQSFIPQSVNEPNPIENYYDKVSRGHQFIDNAFATSHKYEQNRDTLWKKDFVQGEFPPPIGFGSQASKLKKLKKIATNPSLTKQEVEASKKLHINVKNNLKKHQGKYLPEHNIRELVHKEGLKTFPRPDGIPDNYRVKLSETGGMIYMHPNNTHISVRVMPGKTHSPYPYQQKPYVIQMSNGKAFDKYGKLMPKNSPEAHIPIDEFVYRNN